MLGEGKWNVNINLPNKPLTFSDNANVEEVLDLLGIQYERLNEDCINFRFRFTHNPVGTPFRLSLQQAKPKNLGHKIVIVLAGQKLPEDIELVHGFNLGRPDDLLPH